MISAAVYDDVVNQWRRNPLSPREFSSWYLLNKGVGAGVTSKQVEAIIKHTLEYVRQKQPREARGKTQYFSNFEFSRGGLVHADSAYFLKGYSGAWYVTGT